MKRVFITLVICSLIAMTGCKTPIYRPRVSTVSVSKAMYAWDKYTLTGHAKADQAKQVQIAYNLYHNDLKIARLAAAAYKINGDSNQLQRALFSLNTSEPALITLIMQSLPLETAATLKGLR